MSRTVVLSAARTPFGKLGGGLSSVDATELGGDRDRGRARARRGQARPGPARGDGPGAAGRPGADPVPAGPDQGGDPQGGLLGDRQQGLRLEPAGRRHRRPGRARGRPRARRRGRHGVDVGGALPAAQGALRLPHGRRQGGRRDDPRRAHQPVHGQDDGPGGLRGRRGARDDPRRPGPLRAAQPSARRAGDRRGPARRGDRPRDGVLQEGRHHRRDRRGPALARRRSRRWPSSSRSPRAGRHTAGNSPGVNDGAGALVLAAEEWAKANDREWLATIIAQAAVADDFAYLARTPAKATELALEKAGLKIDDIDLFEINEAFASVALNSMRMLGVDEDRVNVNGGAIALGHPIGASGARILTHADLGAPPPRRRARRGRDLLRRRPGRRRHRRGLNASAGLRRGRSPACAVSRRRSARP